MGVSWEQFWNMNPRIIKVIAKGYKERLLQQDYINWINGQYILSAVSTAVEHNLAGRKAHSSYIDKPIMKELEEKNKPLSEEEMDRQRELFVAKLEAMRVNFELNHKKKEADKK